MRHALKKLLLALGLTAFCGAPFAQFDPVNDDTDLFRNNPNIPAERPNVLIILDNTANWNSAFANEKTALVSVINGLGSAFNVGWMMYPETGGGNDSIDGAYVRFGMRQMTTANKTALASMVTAFDITNDKGNNSTLGLAMHEAYLYFGGKINRASFGKVKTDFAGNTANNPLAAPLAGNALPAGPSASSLYSSAVTDACQKNYIIYISNGPANENASARAVAEGLLTTARGSAPPVIAITPNGQQVNWADEYAKFMAESDMNSTLTGSQTAITYTVEVDPGAGNADLAMTALMKSMAINGKGKYFAVTSANAGLAIVEALTSIFNEIQAVNSVFAASTLPVSVNVRGTNLNQLYIGVFRPDASDRPRWLGNLKAYQLKRDSVTNTVFTVDALLNPAINNSTGFITSNAKSFWTDPNVPNSTYWSFRSASVNGVGGSSDSPDGDLVEKGGAAQQLRARYFAGGINGVSPDPSRPLYTCTQGPAFPVCNPNYSGTSSPLVNTPFVNANNDIDAGSLGIDSRIVTPLTAAVTKTISALRDRRDTVLSNTGTNSMDLAFDIIRVGTEHACYLSLNNARSIAITAISNGAVTKNITGIAVANGSNKVAVATSAAHGLTTQQVLLSGTTNFNGLRTITAVTTNTFSFGSFSGPITESSGTVTISNTTVNVTAPAHGFGSAGTVLGNVTIAGVTPAAFNGVKTITIVDPNTFSFPHTVSTGPSATAPGSMSASASSTVVTATSSGACGTPTFAAGQIVNLRQNFASSADPADAYQGAFAVLASPAPTSTSFAYQTSTVIATAAPYNASYTGQRSGTAASAVVYDDPGIAGVPFNFVSGNSFTLNITGATPAGFNGSFTGTAYRLDVDPNACAIPPVQPYFCACGSCSPYWAFQYTVPAGTGYFAERANLSVPIKLAGNTSSIVTATLANHGFVNGATINVSSVTGLDAATWNADWGPIAVVDPNTFTFSTVVPLLAPGGTPQVRLATSPWAYAAMIGHGYGANGTTLDPFTVAGANIAGYNGAFTGASAAVVEDANTVRYRLGSAPGANTGGTMTGKTNSLTAVATSAGHLFTAGTTVTISGATPGQFNGPVTILTVPNADTFTYAITPAAGAATGTIAAISAGGAGASERTNVINWVRGEDNYEDENANSSFTDTRASMHGDVLHSRPAVVNYNRRTSDTANIDNDVYIFYGGNDGVFRAVKGGFGSSTTSTYPSLSANDPAPGQEVWGFVAREHFGSLKRLRLNSPAISSNYKKPYFFDGPLGAYTLDANGDGMLDPNNARAANGTVSAAATGDKVYLYLTMRRGGRAIYALDVSDPLTPKMLWRKGCPSYSTTPIVAPATVRPDVDAATGCDLGWSELGQTWSEPKVVKVTCSTTPCGASDPVLIFGAGFDALVEDPDPSTITSITAAAVVAGGTTFPRSMGRGLFVVNAQTGAIIWHASPKAAAAVSMPPGATYKQVVGMDYAISSDIAVVVGDPTTKPFRAYVGDTGGQMWRFDFGDPDPIKWSVVKLASIADRTTTAVVPCVPKTGGGCVDPNAGVTVIPGQRKFQFAPDVVGSTGFDMVITGSGDREHPFDRVVVNRVYAFKDKRQTASPVDGGGVQIQPTIEHGNSVMFNGSSVQALLNVSTQCIEIPGNCSGTAPEIGVDGPARALNTSNALADTTNIGWYIELAAGEKQVGSTLASGSGVIQFGTNQPSASAGGGACSPNLGVARQYTVNYLDGTAYNGTSLSTLYVGGGFLPSPVLVFVGLGGAAGTGSTSGTGVGVGGTVSGGQLKIGAGASTGGSGNVASAVVCYGASCSLAPGSVLFSRLRKFWYKEID